VDFGKIQVQQNQREVRTFGVFFKVFQERDRLGAVGRNVKLIGKAAMAKDLVDQINVRFVIFHQQNRNQAAIRFAGRGRRR